jgi:hypothetical protein
MSKERRVRLSEILQLMNTPDYYLPVPEWDSYPGKYSQRFPKPKVHGAVDYDVKFLLMTVLGEKVSLIPRKLTDWDWGDIYLTTNCPDCPHFIPMEQEQMPLLIADLRNNLGSRRIYRYEDCLGICNFGLTVDKRFNIPKILTENSRKSIRGCHNSLKDRLERAEEKRQLGNLIS